MPRINFNSKVMHGRTSSKDSMHEVAGSKPALILDDSYGMFYSYLL